MTKIRELFPEIFKHVKSFAAATKETYCYFDVPLATLFQKALEQDEEIDDFFIPTLVEAIPTWLEYPTLIDAFETDEARSEFERTFLHQEENLILRSFLNKNKLRLSPLRNMHAYFEMYPTLLANDQTRSSWKQIFRVINRPNALEKSIYEAEYGISERLYFIQEIEHLIRKICIEYIHSKEQKQ